MQKHQVYLYSYNNKIKLMILSKFNNNYNNNHNKIYKIQIKYYNISNYKFNYFILIKIN